MENKILEIAAEVFDLEPEELNIDMNMEEIGEWDSLAHIRLVTEIEDELGVTIPIDEVSDIKKLSDFLKYTEE